MIEFLTFCLLIIGVMAPVSGQNNKSADFQSPLHIPLYLSGNFGELRTGHFHSGIDLKTQSQNGKPVFCVADGYVSRIKIESGGYGRSVYVTHPNGYTTVYAHLERFKPELEKYIKHNQYLRKSYEIELFPASGMFRFQAGELLAYSGNTGRSGGPHLHFEVRKTDSQLPVNGLLYHLPVADSIPPVFKALFTYAYTGSGVNWASETRNEVALVRINDSLYRSKEPIVVHADVVAFGVEVYDYLNGSSNRCGVYRLEMLVQDTVVFGFQLDQIPFDQTRFINAHMDYDLKSNEGRSIHRLYRLPNNALQIYIPSGKDGVLHVPVDSIIQIQVRAMDPYGNQSILHFACIRKQPDESLMQAPGEKVSWKQGAVLEKDRLKVTVPPGALYRDVNFILEARYGGEALLQDTFNIHTSGEGLQKAIRLELALGDSIPHLSEKLLFVRINGNGLQAEGGDYLQGKLVASVRNMGKYVVMYDTLPPQVIPVKHSTTRHYLAADSLVFQITDNLSGINQYNAYIDNRWALFAYDAKSDRIEYAIDPEYLDSGKQHELRIEVADSKGNATTYKSTFFY